MHGDLTGRPHQGIGTGAMSNPEATMMGRCARRSKCTCTPSWATCAGGRHVDYVAVDATRLGAGVATPLAGYKRYRPLAITSSAHVEVLARADGRGP
jgi:hypothetical protein